MRGVSSCVGFVAGLVPLLVSAQEAGGADATPVESVETVTVFGSRLQNRTAFDSAVPIDVFSEKDIAAASASGELGQVLQSMSPSINMPRASASGTSDSVRTIQLRGLAPDQVLVLVNGKRWHTNAVMDIEGLFPGTVAVDLNAIPVESIERIEVLRDGAGAMYGSDAVAGVVNIVLKSGIGPTDLQMGFGENHTYFAPTNSTITDGRNRTLGGSGSVRIGDGGFLRFGANYQNRAATNRAGPSSATWTSYNSTPADLALDGKVVFGSGDPKLESTGLFYNAELPLGEAMQAYSFATANWRSSRGTAFFRYPGDPTNVASIYPQGFRPISTGASNDIGLVAGLKGVDGGWNWDLSASEGYNRFSYGLTNSLNASLGPVSPTSFHIASFVSRQETVNLDLTRELDAGLAAPIVASLGAQQIFEHYHTGAGDPASYAAGPYTSNGFGEVIPPGAQGDSGLRPQDVVHLSRNVSAAYVELENDVTTRLLLDVAGRYSHYSDHGSSTTGKFAARFKLTDALSLRGAVSNSFRAPALAQTGIRFTTLNFNSTGTGLQNNAWLPPDDPLAQQQGATPLKPERSVNLTAGLAWRSPSRTYATLDFYQVRITDRIVPTGQIPVTVADIASVQYLTNTLDTTTRGFDLVAGQDLDLGSGKLKLTASFNRNYLHEDRDRNPNVAGGLVLVPLEYGSPSTKLVLGGDYSVGRWGAHVQADRFGTVYAYSFDSALPTINGWNVQRYDPLWSFDLEGRVDVWRGVRLAVGGTDVFNRYPPRTTYGGSYGGAFPYNYVHPLGINGAYYYLNLTLTLGE